METLDKVEAAKIGLLAPQEVARGYPDIATEIRRRWLLEERHGLLKFEEGAKEQLFPTPPPM